MEEQHQAPVLLLSKQQGQHTHPLARCNLVLVLRNVTQFLSDFPEFRGQSSTALVVEQTPVFPASVSLHPSQKHCRKNLLGKLQ